MQAPNDPIPDPVPEKPFLLRPVVLVALALGLLLRLFFIFRFAHILGDTLVYGDIARNLLLHHIYGFTDTLRGVRPTLIRLPGYPLFLALCFRLFGLDRYTAILFVQAFLDLGTCLLLAGTARRLFGAAAAIPTLYLAALCPFTANYTAAPLTETPTLFCIALAFYALLRWRETLGLNRWLYTLAFALAWALLLRPEQGMLAACIVPAVFWLSRKTSYKPTIILCALTILPLVPWAARNYHTFHVFQPLAPRFANDPGETTPFGFNRWFRTWAIEFASTDDVYWNYDGSPISIADLPNRAFDSNDQYATTAALLDDYNPSQVATPALDARWNALAQDRIHADPLRYYVALPIARVLNMSLRPRAEMLPLPLEWWKPAGHPRATAFAWLYAALNLAYFVLAALALRHIPPTQRIIVAAMLATILFRAALLLTLDNSEQRYTLEFFPILTVLAGATLARWTSNQATP